MTFQTNAYAFATALPYIGLALVIFLLIRSNYKEHTQQAANDVATKGQPTGPTPRKQLWRDSLVGLGLFVVVMAFVNMIVFAISGSRSNPDSNARYVAQGFGLISGKQYPLKLGPVFAGNSADVTTTGGKSQHTTVHVNADPVVSVSFTHGRNTYLLEIPLAKITFHQSVTKAPSMLLRLKTGYYGGATIKDKFDDCPFVMHNLFITCKVHRVKRTVTISDHTRRLGLARVVLNSLSSADFTLTPTMYNQLILGR
jgi:hypothetical protein